MTRPFAATRLTAAEATAQMQKSVEIDQEVGATISEAKALIETARQEARRVQELSEAKSRERDTALQGIANAAVDRYLDTKRVEAAATAAARLIRDAGEIREEFDSMIPWLTEFLEVAITRLIGQLDDEDVLSRLVAEGVSSLKDARQVTVLVHPADLAHLQATRTSYPVRFSGVADIRGDARLQPGAVSLEGAGGSVDASLVTQVEALCAALEAHL